MSCFWDTIIVRMRNRLLENINKDDINPKNIVDFLKKHNIKTLNVKWNGDFLSKQQLIENQEHIKNYNIDTVNEGYLCSTCDPFLLLLCEIYNIDIHNNYLNNNIIYNNILNISKKKIVIENNKSHMK